MIFGATEKNINLETLLAFILVQKFHLGTSLMTLVGMGNSPGTPSLVALGRPRQHRTRWSLRSGGIISLNLFVSLQSLSLALLSVPLRKIVSLDAYLISHYMLCRFC